MAATGQAKNSPLELWITPEVSKFVDHEYQDDSQNVDIFDITGDGIDEADVIDATPVHSSEAESPSARSTTTLPADFDRIVGAITGQFLEKFERTQEMLFELRSELVDKERQLKLLPDLQRKEEEARQLAELKGLALEKQVAELKVLNEKLQRDAEEASAKLLLSQQKKNIWQWLFSPGSNISK